MSEMIKFLGYEMKEDSDKSMFPSLSYKERMIGFGVCFSLGLLIQFMSMGSVLGIILGKPEKFAVLYTFGNLISIFGTFFLMGPINQIKRMKDPVRLNSSVVFISSLVMTLISVYVLHSKLLTIIFLIVQFCSYIWYILSYIPYGRDILMNCLKSSAGRL